MRAFVLMPFDAEFDAVYEKLIKAPLEESGYEVSRADSGLDQRNILRDVVEGIARADLVIADLTAKNPNVFYELGLCHGLRVPTILITQSIEDVPFDLRSYRCIGYSTHFQDALSLPGELRKIAEAHSRERVRFGSPVTDHLSEERRSTPSAAVEADGCDEIDAGPDDGKEPGDELGLLDYVAEADASGKAIATFVYEIGQGLEAVNGQVRTHAVALKQLGDGSAPGSATKAQRVMLELSRDMEAYAALVRERLPELETAIDAFAGSIRGYAEWYSDAPEEASEHLGTLRAQMESLLQAATTALKGLRELRDSIGSLRTRRISRAVNRAADRMLQVTDRFVGQLERVEAFCENTIALLTRQSRPNP